MDIKTIKEKIKNSEVVSFDVFDTLIMRKVLFPEDVFELVERYAQKEGLKVSEYKKLRIRSDYENPHILPTIYEIYDYLQVLGNITEDVKRKLLNYEVEVEQNVLIRREDMMELFNYAVALGKPVYLISDMYLPKSILQSILKRLNIHEYKDIFISCEYKKSKQDGLYTVFKKNMCEESFIHIGDNIKSDIEAANHSGIEGFLIKSALELLKISTYSEILEYNLGLEERCLIGLAVSRLFNSPFTVLDNNRRPCITEAKDIGVH